ncbi:MAG: DinB family protein [Cyclobacteriaceae bacterium]|nr:DinB family protein [Cyclobacteriaceae bacterium]
MTHQEYLFMLEQQVEEQLKEVIAVFQNLPEDRLLQPAANGGWSMAECLEHLNTYADFYLPRLQKALSNAPALQQPDRFKHSLLGRYFIAMMNPDKSTKKYKAMKRYRPVTLTDPHAVVSRFIQHLEELLKIVMQAEQKNLMKVNVTTTLSPLIKIPAGDAIQFVLTHNRRHLLQAGRNLENETHA